MHHIEKNLVFASVALMLVFAALVIYANVGYGIHLPGHEMHMTPFTEATVIQEKNNQFVVNYVARMWAFEPAEVVLPENADVQFYVSAVDVNHGFEIAGTNVNLMAVPGTVNGARHTFNHEGDYLVVCHEYCGLNHQNMLAKIRIVEAKKYTELLEQQSGASKLTGDAALGQKLSDDLQCSACHTADGTEGLAPTFKGMYGRKEELNDESYVTVDDNYIVESILHPDTKIVEDYEAGSMPVTPVTPEQMKQLIAYIKALR